MSRSRCAGGLFLAPLWLLAVPAVANSGAKVTCEITENGQPASGTISISADGAEVVEGTCGRPLAIPAGTHEAVLRLDGALDGPERRLPLEAIAGRSIPVSADFATGLLEVRIQSQGRDTAGIAVIRKAGRQVGTLGSGVTAHLSVGSYEVIARYRSHEQRFDAVEIRKGERKALAASF
jgi:hypothetical protein